MILQPVFVRGSSGGGTDFSIQANCDAGVSEGDVVYVSSDKVGSYYQVAKVDIDNTDSVQAIGIGIVSSKSSSTTCTVYLSGVLPGVYSGLTPGKRLFVDTSARLVQTPPSRPLSGKRIVQKVAYALASDTILIRPEEPIQQITA